MKVMPKNTQVRRLHMKYTFQNTMKKVQIYKPAPSALDSVIHLKLITNSMFMFKFHILNCPTVNHYIPSCYGKKLLT